MYLVQQARDLMSRNFVVLPIETPIGEALKAVLGKPSTHIVVADERRIAGFVRFAAVPYAPAANGEQTLRDIVSDDFVIAPETSILNAIISRMSRRGAVFRDRGQAGRRRAAAGRRGRRDRLA